MIIFKNWPLINIMVFISYFLFLYLAYKLVFLWRKADIPNLTKISLDQNFLVWNYLYILFIGALIAIHHFLSMVGISEILIEIPYLEVISLYLLCLLLYQWLKVLKRAERKVVPEDIRRHASKYAPLSMEANKRIG